MIVPVGDERVKELRGRNKTASKTPSESVTEIRSVEDKQRMDGCLAG